MNTVMTSHCPTCGAEVQAADFHFIPRDGEVIQTYECLSCGEERDVNEWLRIYLEKARKDALPKA